MEILALENNTICGMKPTPTAPFSTFLRASTGDQKADSRRQMTEATALLPNNNPPSGFHSPPTVRHSSFRPLQTTIHSDLRDVLYLVNLLDLLDLPESWGHEDSDDGHLAPHMSGWAIVEALARGLLVGKQKSYESDPIWTTLASLDGREAGTPIGVGLPVQTDFRLPAQWLRRFGPASHVWVALQDDSRLRLVDPSHDYLVADVALNGLPPAQVARAEIEAYRKQGVGARYAHAFTLYCLPFPALPSTVAEHFSEPAAWWLVRMLDFVRYLLSTVSSLSSRLTVASQ